MRSKRGLDRLAGCALIGQQQAIIENSVINLFIPGPPSGWFDMMGWRKAKPNTIGGAAANSWFQWKGRAAGNSSGGTRVQACAGAPAPPLAARSSLDQQLMREAPDA